MKLKLLSGKVRLIFFLFLFFSFLIVSAQTKKTVSGTVLSSEDNFALPGASVIEKGTANGTSTDFDGKFTLTVSENATLVISYVGYVTQEVAVTSSPLTILMQIDQNALDEVVVIGYGTQKKSVVTGAISSVKAKDIEAIPQGRIEQALQGRVSGVTIAANSGQPGEPSTVRVRGLTTFSGSGNNPIWVVDGVIVDNAGIGYINQSDIESIEVLKDAASQAIYGARAASGVILITTKKGKSGKIAVNYTGYVGFSGPETKLDLLNATQYGAIMNEKSLAAGGDIVFPDIYALGKGTDWQDAIFNNNAQRYSHEVSVSGGNDVSTFFASFGLQDTEGIVLKQISKYNKKNFRLNSNHKLSDIFTIGQTLGYTNQKKIGLGNTNSEFGGPLSSAINLDPITPIVVTDPAIANDPNGIYANNPVFRDKNGNPYGISSIVGQEMSNPVGYVNTRLGNYDWSDDFVGNAFLKINPIEGLEFKTSLGAKLAFWGYEYFTPKFFLSSNVFASQNSLSITSNRSFGWNIENTLSYSKKIADHNFSLLIGQGTYVDNIARGTYVSYSDLDANTHDQVGFPDDYPSDRRTGTAYLAQEHRVTSLFSRLTYDYKEKYLFTGIIRRDGSSRFGANNKYGVFPSFSAGWVVSNEDFWKENNIVNTLKLRGGYGVTGNDNFPDNRFLALIDSGRNYTFGSDGSSISIGNSPSAPSNPDLKWEETSQANVGFDARLFNDFNLTAEYYNKKTKGILRQVPIPGYIGATGQPWANVADMENKGFEIELGYRKKFGNFNLSVNGNLAYLKNEVTWLGEDIKEITGGASFQSMGPVTVTKVGEAFNSFYGFRTNGIFQSEADIAAYTNSAGIVIQPNAKPGDFRWVDTNDDGAITNDDKQILGTPFPKYTFGLTINLDYKGFDFMAFAQGTTGNTIFQGLRRLDILNSNYQTEVLNRWVGAGTSNSYPRVTNDDTNGNFGRPSDFYLEKGDYLRLKVVQLGYTIPNEALSKFGIQKLRIFVTGENLLTLTDYTGYDPEIGGSIFGIDRGYYPQAKSFMFGANLQF